ncbi:MAG: carbohydrate ABC transporter permease [Candidatus Borkfalkiaceae bacterium]|nr:carbohydrate ABC transporter permease [Christensenellaceae bacterium]
MTKRHAKGLAGQIADHILLVLLLVVMVYPLLMAVWCSFKSNAEFEVSKWYPTLPINLENLFYATKNLYGYIFNTVFVGAVGTFGMLVVSSLAAYAFARMRFFLKDFLFSMVIGLMMVPAIMTLVPSFMLYKKLVGTNTYTILILPIITGGSVFGVFLLRSFFGGLSESIFEAARIDGAGDLTCYFRICLPLSVPILATLAIMQLSGTWNDYIWPMIAVPTATEKLTIAAAIKKEFLSANTGSYPTLFAGYLISSVPLILLYVFSNKFYVEGLTNAAVKF